MAGGKGINGKLFGATFAVGLLAWFIANPADALARRHRAAAGGAAAPAANDEAYAEASVLEPVSGTFIFEKDDHKPWPTASLAKMMLMLIVVEKLNDGSLKLADQISSSRGAVKMGGSQVYLKEGEVFSLDDMMKAIVVHSANDASYAVAEHIGGSGEAFVAMMNQRAAAIGMKDTHYYSVHGLPPSRGEQADVASAYDQAILARELLKYPDVIRWSSIDTAPFRAGTFQLRNTNHLIRTYNGCDGLKTGFYDKAGFNVVATARRNGMRLIAVVLGTQHKLTNFKQAAELMSSGFAQYEMRPMAKKGAPIPSAVAVSGGAVPELKPVMASDAAVFMKRGDQPKDVKLAYHLPPSVAAPIKAGQQIGTADVVQSGKVVTTVALVAPADVAKKSGGLFSRLTGKD
jgi:D-alanyl-D-alanine carboxypeptidase (penicillin-binding protein 5/6)